MIRFAYNYTWMKYIGAIYTIWFNWNNYDLWSKFDNLSKTPENNPNKRQMQ